MSTGIAPETIGFEVRLGRVGRENRETKARRILVEGRLAVGLYDSMRVEATCRGTEEVHRLGFVSGSWWCSCPARGRCSHITALQLVAPRPLGGPDAG